MIWTIIELDEDIMVLNNVTKFHKILIQTIRLGAWTSLGQTYVSLLANEFDVHSILHGQVSLAAVNQKFISFRRL